MRHAAAERLREGELDTGRPEGAELRLVEPDWERGEIDPVNGRRTIRITGQPVPPRRRRSAAHEQIVARPDRIALWAFLLGLFLVFMAVATANAATF
jgi:hypothetical protein